MAETREALGKGLVPSLKPDATADPPLQYHVQEGVLVFARPSRAYFILLEGRGQWGCQLKGTELPNNRLSTQHTILNQPLSVLLISATWGLVGPEGTKGRRRKNGTGVNSNQLSACLGGGRYPEGGEWLLWGGHYPTSRGSKFRRG